MVQPEDHRDCRSGHGIGVSIESGCSHGHEHYLPIAVLGQTSINLVRIQPYHHARSSVSQGCDVDFLVLDPLQNATPTSQTLAGPGAA